jgi:hypothetical protein
VSLTRSKYGLEWPEQVTDVFIELTCAKKWREPPFNKVITDPGAHLLRAARMLFTPTEFTISPWSEEHAEDWTKEKFCITWGGASCSKSNDYGLFCLLDWLTDPMDTVTLLASTTLGMLELRSFESVIRYFKILKKHPTLAWPGKYVPVKHHIVNIDDADVSATAKAAIKGVAVKQGNTDKARSDLQGAHLPYVRLILDEMSQMPDAAEQARYNLSIGAKDFRFFGLCNPDSVYDLAGRFSIPVDGWDAVDETSTRWETQWGSVRHHNGFDSPAVTEPNGIDKYPYLINQKQIDERLKENHGNDDHPLIWTMIRGWPPPQGATKTVLNESMIRAFKMHDGVIWDRDYIVLASFDPAFTSDGDDPVLQIAHLGMSREGVLTLLFTATEILTISASSKDRPVVYQLADQLKEFRYKYGFDWDNLAVDDSGTQSVADVIDAENSCHCFRVNFAWKASDMQVSTRNPAKAKELYKNRITEYYFALVEYAQFGQIRGLPADAAQQFCARRIAEKKRPFMLESKKDAKTRIQRSPDQADACAILVGMCREKLGVLAGESKAMPGGVSQAVQGMSGAQMLDYNNLEETYGTGEPAEVKPDPFDLGASEKPFSFVDIMGDM